MWRVLLLSAVVACTKPNPEVCCLDATDCASIGVTDPVRECSEGLACVDNQCAVPTCSTQGCGAEAPVCDIRTDVCVGCTDSTECERFAETSLCDVASGGCVQCIAPADCGLATPVCDAGACRACVLDSECDSGACGDEGACVDESEIVYLTPDGSVDGTCSRQAPCGSLRHAVTQTSITRSHVVLADGTYNEPLDVNITPAQTSSPNVTIHGGGATVDGMLERTISITIASATLKDLTIVNSGAGLGLNAENGSTTLERVNIVARKGLLIVGNVTARDLSIEASVDVAVDLSDGSFDVDGATLTGAARVIETGNTTTTILMKNALLFGSSDVAADLLSTSGALEFVTITNAGSSSAGPSLLCSPGLSVRSTIVWTPNTGKPPITGGCSLTNVIAGPPGVVGAANTDPLFVNPLEDDYHLSPNSPARDAVNTGPTRDFEGDPRPRGDRFDLGADEAP